MGYLGPETEVNPSTSSRENENQPSIFWGIQYTVYMFHGLYHGLYHHFPYLKSPYWKLQIKILPSTPGVYFSPPRRQPRTRHNHDHHHGEGLYLWGPVHQQRSKWGCKLSPDGGGWWWMVGMVGETSRTWDWIVWKKTMNWMDQVDLRIFREIAGILISQKFRFEVLGVKSYLCSGSSRKYRRFAKFWLKPTARRI